MGGKGVGGIRRVVRFAKALVEASLRVIVPGIKTGSTWLLAALGWMLRNPAATAAGLALWGGIGILVISITSNAVLVEDVELAPSVLGLGFTGAIMTEQALASMEQNAKARLAAIPEVSTPYLEPMKEASLINIMEPKELSVWMLQG